MMKLIGNYTPESLAGYYRSILSKGKEATGIYSIGLLCQNCRREILMGIVWASAMSEISFCCPCSSVPQLVRVFNPTESVK